MNPEREERYVRSSWASIIANVHDPSDSGLYIDEGFFQQLSTCRECDELNARAVTDLNDVGHLVKTIHVEVERPYDDDLPGYEASKNYNYLRDLLSLANGASQLILDGDNVEAMGSLVKLLEIRTESVRKTPNTNLQHYESLALYVTPDIRRNALNKMEMDAFMKRVEDLGKTTEIKHLKICTSEVFLASALLRSVRRFEHLESLHCLPHRVLGEYGYEEEWSLRTRLQELLPYGSELVSIDWAMNYIGQGRSAIKDIGVPACVHENTLRVFANLLVGQNAQSIVRFALYGVGYVKANPQHNNSPPDQANVEGTVSILDEVATTNKHLKRVFIDGYVIPERVYDALINVVERSETHDLRPRSLVVRDRFVGDPGNRGMSRIQAERLRLALQDSYHVYVEGLAYRPFVDYNVKLMVASYSRLNQHGRAWVMDAATNVNELLRRASEMLSSVTAPDLYIPDEDSAEDDEPSEVPDNDAQAREKINAAYLFVRVLFGYDRGQGILLDHLCGRQIH